MKPIRSRKVYQEITGRILQLLTRGDLKIGDKLPSERELAQVLNVSRTSVRDALRTLESIGLIEIKRGDGTYLRKLSSEAFVQPLVSFISPGQASLEEIFEARKIIEPEVAALAAERANKVDILAMEEALARQSEEIKAGRSGEEFDTEFHLILARIPSNPVVLTLMNTLIDVHHESRLMAHRTTDLSRRSLADHKAVLDAVRNRQPEIAREVMWQHLQAIENLLTVSEEGKDVSLPQEDRVTKRSSVPIQKTKGGEKK